MRKLSDQAVDDAIAQFNAAGNLVAAAAWMLRHRGICPMCGAGPVGVTNEDPVTGLRHFLCGACHWPAKVTEGQFRGTPHIGLRGICTAAVEVRRARAAAKRTTRRPRRPRAPAPERPAPRRQAPTPQTDE